VILHAAISVCILQRTEYVSPVIFRVTVGGLGGRIRSFSLAPAVIPAVFPVGTYRMSGSGSESGQNVERHRILQHDILLSCFINILIFQDTVT